MWFRKSHQILIKALISSSIRVIEAVRLIKVFFKIS